MRPVAKRGLAIAVLICAAALAAPALAGHPMPTSVGKYLLGPKMIRGEIVVKGSSTTLHDYRLDRGKLLKRYAAGTLNLLERDGTKTPVKVAAGARVFLNGLPSTLRRLRAGMQIAVAHDRDLPADTVYAASGKGIPRWPGSVIAVMFGNRLVRGEIALQDTTLHDYRVDQGRIKQVGVFTLLLKEMDATEVTINVSPTARIKLNGKNATFVQLRKGMMATTIHDGDKPADQVYATGR
jgi:hypothetical protein